MRITIQAQIEGPDDQGSRSVTVGVINRDADSAPASGLGLFLGEAHGILQKLQTVMLQQEAAEFVEAAPQCGTCSAGLATKDTKTLVYRTAFGKARLGSPRFYSRCSGCGTVACCGQTFSPHAYITGFNPHQGIRQQAFLSSVGIAPDTPVTVIPDGGEDISFACQLPSAIERVLDWFHIGMRFEHLLTAVRGMRDLHQPDKDILVRRAEGAKWLLWHGQQERCLQRLESLRRDTGWVGPRNPLGRLILYLRGCATWLINYAKRYAEGRPISSAGAESAVDYVVGQRMKRNGHMQWTREGANALLQVRCAVLNGQDVRNFKRWYPPDQRIDGLAPRSAAA